MVGLIREVFGSKALIWVWSVGGGCIIEGGELNVYYDELEGGCNRSHNRRNIARSIQQTSVTLPGPLIVSELFDFHAAASE